MPAVATTFGRVLGPAGKMPTPQLGVLMNENDKAIKELVDKIKELEALNKTMVGRELKMVELKKEIENLKKKA